MNNRLQFVHHGDGNEGIFKTREEAIAYVTGNSVVNTTFKITGDTGADNAIDWLPLYGEPMVLEYGDVDNPNVILAIGSKGDGRTPSTKNRVFFIDIEGVNERVDNAFDKIEEAVKKFAFVTKNSNTISLTKTQPTDGSESVVSGSVRHSDTVIVNHKEVENIIKENKDGLYSYVNMSYDKDKQVLKFQVNEKEEEVNIPTIKNAYYDITKEAIVFNYTDGKTLEIDMDDLIDEWTTEGEASSTPVVLTRERHSDTGVADKDRRSGKWKDVLKADVRIAPTEMGVDNILKTVGDGKYLYVSGQAKSITYYDKNGKKTNVQDALDSIKTPISNDPTNLLQWKYGVDNVIEGLYAGLDVDYDEKTNTITFTNTSSDKNNKKKSFKLNSASFINRIYTDTVNEKIILEYYDQQGALQTSEIDISHLVDEWVVNNEAHSVELKKQTRYPGGDILTADVKIYNDINGNNAIKEVGSEHGLFVDRRATNIKYQKNGKETNVQAELDGVNKEITKLNNDVKVNVGESSTVILSKEPTADGQVIKGQVKLSPNKNLVINKADGTGLIATIDYDPIKNELIVSDSTEPTHVRHIPLASKKIVKKAEYLAETEELVLEFDDTETSNGEVVRIPLGGLISEWTCSADNNRAHTIELQKTRVVNGKDILVGDVHIVEYKEDNLLKQVEEGGTQKLYVSGKGITDNKVAIDGLKKLVEDTTRALGDKISTRDLLDINTKIDTLTDGLKKGLITDSELNTKVKDIEQRIATYIGQINNLTQDVTTNKSAIDLVEKKGKYIYKSENATIKFNVTKDGIDTLTNVVNAQVLPSTAADNIIKVANDADGAGVFASVSLRYDGGSNALKWKTSAMAQEETITLNAGSIIKSMVYDKENKTLVITYETDVEGRKTQNTLTVPVTDLFNEWDVKNYETKGAIKLVKNDTGMVTANNNTDILSARIILAGEGNDVDHSDNLISISNNGLYVGGDRVKTFIKNETKADNDKINTQLAAISKIMSGKAELTQHDTYENVTDNTAFPIIMEAKSLADADKKLADGIKKLAEKLENAFKWEDTYSTSITVDTDGVTGAKTIKPNVRLAHYNGNDGSANQTDIGNENVEVPTMTAIGNDYNLLKVVHVRDSKENAGTNGLYFDGSIDYGTF